MANQIIDKALNNLAQVAIVESGTSGAWTYKKYGDGTADLWLKYTEASATAFSKADNVYYRVISGFNFPFQFTEIPIVTVTIGMANIGAAEFTALTTQSMDIAVISASASARTVTIHAHIYGKWQ